MVLYESSLQTIFWNAKDIQLSDFFISLNIPQDSQQDSFHGYMFQ